MGFEQRGGWTLNASMRGLHWKEDAEFHFNILLLHLQWKQQWSSKVYNGKCFILFISPRISYFVLLEWKSTTPQPHHKMTKLMSAALSLYSKRKLLALVALFSYFPTGEDIQGCVELPQCFLFFPTAAGMPWHTHNFILLRSRMMSLFPCINPRCVAA